MPFWPSLFQASNLTQKYVHKILMFSDSSSLLKEGNLKKKKNLCGALKDLLALWVLFALALQSEKHSKFCD